jgi:signal peptidase II
MSDLLRRTLFSPLSLACFLLTAAIGFGLDQWSKHEAFTRLCTGVDWIDGVPTPEFRKTVAFIPGLIDFTVTTNQGAVFGFGQGKRTLFIIVSVAAILFIGYLFITSGNQRMYQIILGMLLAGVLGNLYDRLRFSYVRDMIHGLPRSNLFPYIFNVADTLLCMGVGLMVVYSLFHNPDRRRPQAVEPEAA